MIESPEQNKDLCQTNIDANNLGTNIMMSIERKQYIEKINKKTI